MRARTTTVTIVNACSMDQRARTLMDSTVWAVCWGVVRESQSVESGFEDCGAKCGC